MGTFERSPFLRFSSGPSPKHHRVGENPAPGTLPVCPRAPALLPTATEFMVLPPPASSQEAAVASSQEAAVDGQAWGRGEGLFIFKTPLYRLVWLPFLNAHLAVRVSWGCFSLLCPLKKKNLVDLDFLFSNGIWRKKDRD